MKIRCNRRENRKEEWRNQYAKETLEIDTRLTGRPTY